MGGSFTKFQRFSGMKEDNKSNEFAKRKINI